MILILYFLLNFFFYYYFFKLFLIDFFFNIHILYVFLFFLFLSFLMGMALVKQTYSKIMKLLQLIIVLCISYYFLGVHFYLYIYFNTICFFV